MSAAGSRPLKPGDHRAPCGIAIICALALAACDRPGPAAPSVLGVADTYSIAAGRSLQRAAPGVLANDALAQPGFTAQLATRAQFGEVTLEADGSFTYEPSWRFTGYDGFTYQLTDGVTTSAPVPVRISPPNVVVILVDDLGQGDIGAYTNGTIRDTPNLDALAKAGIAFNHAHAAAAVCSPSRYSVLTGNYPYRGRMAMGVWDSYDPATMIIPGQATLGDIFSNAGYTTGFVGKLHNGGAFWNKTGTRYTRSEPDVDFSRRFDRGPTQFGFDYSFVLPGGNSGPPYAYFENDRLVRFDTASGTYQNFANPAAAADKLVFVSTPWNEQFNGGFMGAPGVAIDNFDARQTGGILTRKALGFMQQAIAENQSAYPPKPFFLFFVPPQIHPPYSPPEFFDVTQANDVTPLTRGTAVAGTAANPRADSVRETDLIVGALVDFLAQQNALENTLIIFSSDNGPVTWPDRYPPGTENGVQLRGYKGEIHEGGHRVPLLARWGDGRTTQAFIAPGTNNTQLLGLNDLAATFHDLLGTQRPVGEANDSQSFLPALLGDNPTGSAPRRHLIVQGSPPSAKRNNLLDRAFYRYDSAGALWKLTVVSDRTDPLAAIDWRELYNLSADPAEANNLLESAEHQDLLQAMQDEYLQLIAQPRTVISFK